MNAFLIATAVQGAVIFFDEFYFHFKRGLPLWERIGHPIDSLSVLMCLVFLIFAPKNQTTEFIYIGMALLSCICVTKDEFIHCRLCEPKEMWLHSILFVVHPIVLFTAMNEWEIHTNYLIGGLGAIFCFMIYQILYWNFIAAKFVAVTEKES
jgi:hypothetical protein